MWIKDIRPIREIRCEIKRNEKGRGKEWEGKIERKMEWKE